MALATQAKLTPTKHNEILQTDQDDDTSMSTDEYHQTQTNVKSRTKSGRGKLNKSGSKTSKQLAAEAIQYGPIVVKPRKSTAPTLANGRKSKDEPVCFSFQSINNKIFFFSYHQMKMSNVNNVVIEINKLLLNVDENEMIFVKH